jgi:hypothetical protein
MVACIFVVVSCALRDEHVPCFLTRVVARAVMRLRMVVLHLLHRFVAFKWIGLVTQPIEYRHLLPQLL